MSPPDSHHGPLTLAGGLRFVPSEIPHGPGLLHQRSTGLVARVGPVEWEVLRRFDGAHTDVVRQRVERECGFQVTSAELNAFARRARAAGLLECPGSPSIARPRSRGMGWNIPIWNPEHVFAWCASRASLLFHPMSLAGGAAIVAFAAVDFWRSSYSREPLQIPSLIQLATFLALLNIISVVHECGHGLALHRCGGRVREVGVRFVLGWPCWYCDITESYLLPERSFRSSRVQASCWSRAVPVRIFSRSTMQPRCSERSPFSTSFHWSGRTAITCSASSRGCPTFTHRRGTGSHLPSRATKCGSS
jgi:hypothetical protein